MTELSTIEAKTIAFIEQGDGSFDDVLREIVAYQRKWNRSLADYWSSRGFHESSDLASVPGVPTDVFRHVELVSSEAPITRTFRTSGTTSGLRGQSPRISTRVYDASALAQARALFDWPTSTQFLNAVLDPNTHPDSSLSHMVELFNQRIADQPRPYYLTSTGLLVEQLASAIAELNADRPLPKRTPDQRNGAARTPPEEDHRTPREHHEDTGPTNTGPVNTGPSVLFGTAFALAHFAETASERTPLPDHSLIIETGGFKGKHRELSRPDLYRILSEQFALPVEQIRSEYSMTELSSQLYSLPWRADGPQLLQPPLWCRVTAVDPHDLTPLGPNKRGLLRFVDLANVDTVVAVQTSDLGEVTDAGHVVLHGRAPGSVPRGCSLATEEILALTERKGST